MSRLNEIIQIVTANSEESVDDLLTMLAPDNTIKEEMKETYEGVLGYDPISYYDKKELSEKVDTIIDSKDTPEDTASYLVDNKEDVISDSYDIFDANRSDYLEDVLNDVIEDRTGYNPSSGDSDEEDDDMLDEDYDD